MGYIIKGDIMSRIKITQLAVIGIVSGMLFFSGCTRSEQAFVTGAVVGAVVMGVFDHPRYRDRPYYYYNNQYYYGGRYQNGYYYYQDQRFNGGHYYPYP